MKKLLLLCVTLGVTFLSAQKSNNIPLGVVITNPPKVVKNKFEAAHPHAHATWQMEMANYVADYTDSTNTEYNIVYDKNGNLIRTDRVLDETSYPPPIEDYNTQYYPGEKYEVWYSEDSHGNKIYYSKRKSGISRFDIHGNYVTADNENNQTR